MIPRLNSEFVQSVLSDDSIQPIHSKAYMIHKFDYDMACRETDGMLPHLMGVEEIKKEIQEYNNDI